MYTVLVLLTTHTLYCDKFYVLNECEYHINIWNSYAPSCGPLFPSLPTTCYEVKTDNMNDVHAMDSKCIYWQLIIMGRIWSWRSQWES